MNGYKLTEAGLIPEDWDVSTVGREFHVQLGKMLDAERNKGVPKPYVGNRAVRWGSFDTAEIRSVPMSPADLARYRLKAGDILACEGGEVGRSAIWNDEIPECYYQKALHRLRPKNNYNSRLLVALFYRASTSGGFANFVSQTSIAHLTKEKFQTFPIIKPSEDEQAAIAEALSDMDEAIAAQVAVVAKKRALKTATMQALLSGTRRLPGFSGEWERRSFDRLFQFLRNGSASRAALSTNGAIGYIHYGDVHASPRPHMDCSKGALPRVSREVVNRLPRVQDGDLLIADASEDYDGTGKSVEATNIGNDEVVAGLHTLLLRPVDKMAPGFAGYLQFIPEVKRQYVAAAQGVSVYGLSRSAVKSVEVATPKYDEQAAISSCLMDMETDLSLQQAQFRKLCDLKAGMAQQLLTGKIRLA